MILYDMKSDVSWFYDGDMTADEMKSDRRYETLFMEPCVLYDDGAGKVYRFETLSSLAAKCAVPSTGVPEDVLSMCESAMSGTYEAPGVGLAREEAESASKKADEAKTAADEAKATADTAAVSVNEYIDALLGLDATNETEAADAE